MKDAENYTSSNFDDPARERALRLIKYLQALASLRTKIVRNIKDYENILWLHEIPDEKEYEKECFTQAWGRDDDIEPDIWIEIKKRDEPVQPKVPELCDKWVHKETLRDTDELPELFPTIKVEVEGQDIQEDTSLPLYEEQKLEDFPAVQEAWDQYLENEWLPWMELHRKWVTVQNVYTKLFTIWQGQKRLGEEYELLVGIGLLTWQTPSGHTVHRHLVTARASLDFETKFGKFKVVPEPDGAKLTAELDMLDATEQPLHAQQSAMDGLRSAEDNPWDRASVDAVLHALAKVLGPLGEYHPASLEPRQSKADNKPIVEFAPALIFRKRSLKGLQETLDKMHSKINEGGEMPPEFLDLAEGGLLGERSEPDPANKHDTDIPDSESTIFFPKPSNEEQRRIIKTLRATSGVLVQGPPGTGKSHTIANLICHLLAKGHRVLVTAQTPRALEVLHNHLPEKIRPLCISLLGSGNKEQRALEESVSGILNQETQWDELNATSEVTTLKEKLHQVRTEKAGTDFRLQSIRECETHEQSILNGAYCGTAAKISRQLNKELAEYGWLTDPIGYDQEMPVAPSDLEGLRLELTNFTPELEAELKLSMLDPQQDLINIERFKKLVQQEIELSESLESNQALSNSPIDTIQLADIQHVSRIIEDVSSLVAEAQSVKSRPMAWIESAVHEMLSDNDRPWKELHRVSDDNLRGLRERADKVDRQKLDAPSSLDRRKLLNDAKTLKQHFDHGGTIRWPWFINKKIIKNNKDLIKHVRIDGHLCNASESLTELIEHLSVEQVIEYMWHMWKGKASKREGSFLIQVAELEELLKALTRVIGLYDLLENAKTSVRQDPKMPEPVWHDIDALRKFMDICKLVIKKNDLESVQQELSESISRIREFARRKSSHPLAQNVLNAMQNRDIASYERNVNRLFELQQLSKQLIWTESVLDHLKPIAPMFSNELKATCQDEKWINRIRAVEKAWNWARARSWLRDFLNAEDAPSLERRVQQLEKEEKDTLANLAEIQAWKFCFMRLQKEHRRRLIGWQQAMKRIGRGTGKSAPRHRRNAQQHLNKCREAVPAWVMPLHRLWDTVDPSPGMFDVIIVDEASQCGTDSLPLMYLGKKLLVVGDDQQISPEIVGVDESTRQRLIQEHLYDFEHADSFDMESSLFAHGRRRFNNRIVLREHFRCMPEIIRFSNDLCYHDTPLIPLRRYPPKRLEPLKSIHVSSGYREGDGARAINRPEAETLVQQIVQCCQDERYNEKTMGVIVLQGQTQAQLIENMLVKELGVDEMEKRKLICGNPYDFQGDEREIIFLSMVAAPNQRIGAFTKAADQRRFNVAASRAKDQMWLFHTATINDLSDTCLRKRLLEFFNNPESQITQALGEKAEQLREKARSANRGIETPPSPFDSWFEVDVCLAIAARGYRVIPQYRIAGKSIDLVVEGKDSQLAVECDGDHWHGADRYQEDMERQRKLERAGWQFHRIRESSFYANQEKELEGLRTKLRELNIFPVSSSGNTPNEVHKHKRNKSDKNFMERETYTDAVTEPTVEAKTHEKHPVESQSRLEEVLALASLPQKKEIEKQEYAMIDSSPLKQQQQNRRDERKRVHLSQATRQWMSQFEKTTQEANRDPLNQAAKWWLLKTNTPISEGSQYVVQLMTWGMDEECLEFDNQQQTEKFRTDLAELAGRDNQWFLLQYLKGPPEDPRLDETDLQSASSPEQAAWRLIDVLCRVFQERRDKEKLNIERLYRRSQQIEKVNKHPLNQVALHLLRKTKEPVNADMQYCLQLMLWGLKEGDLVLPDPWQTEMFKNTLIRMIGEENQEAILHYLIGDPEEPNVDDVSLERAEDLRHAAWHLIDALDSLMCSDPDNNGIYPPQDPLRLDGD